VASCRRSVRYLLSVDVGSALPYKCPQLCAPENYSRIAKLITDTLNEDVAYSTQPIELRNQRVYAIKVITIGGIPGFINANTARLASMASSTLQDKHTRKPMRMPSISWLI
jgi:hypothetical protein